jgi:hypothetical protein
MLLVQLRWHRRDGVFRQIIMFLDSDSIYICLVSLKIEGNKGVARLSFHSLTPPLLLWRRIVPDGCVVTASTSRGAPLNTRSYAIRIPPSKHNWSMALILSIPLLLCMKIHCALSSWRSFSLTWGVLGDLASYHRQPQVLPLLYGMGIRLDVEPSLYPFLVPWFLLHPTPKESTDRPTNGRSYYLISRHPCSFAIVARSVHTRHREDVAIYR